MSYIEDPQKWFKLVQRFIACICIFIPFILRSCDKDSFNPIAVNATALTHISDCHDSISVDTYIKQYKADRETRWVIKDCRLNTIIIDAAKIKKYYLGFRASISNYAYSSNSYLYGMLYCMAALLFIYNGIMHIKIFKDKTSFLSTNLNTGGSWCYIVIGVSLIMVILNPMHDREIVHYIFAVLFFGFNIYALAFLPNHGLSKHDKMKRYIVAAIAAIALIVSLFINGGVLWGEWISLFIIATHLFLIAYSVDLKLNSRYK